MVVGDDPEALREAFEDPVKVAREGRKAVDKEESRPRSSTVDEKDLAPEDLRSVTPPVPDRQSVREAGESCFGQRR